MSQWVENEVEGVRKMAERITELERELAEARAILADFVRETDEWNASMERIIGKVPGYCWQTLERARAALAETEGKPR